MKQITSKRNGRVQYIDDVEFAWLVKTKRASRFNIVEMPSFKLPKIERLTADKVEAEKITPRITKTKIK